MNRLVPILEVSLKPAQDSALDPHPGEEPIEEDIIVDSVKGRRQVK